MTATLYLGTKNYSSWSLRPWLAAKKAQIAFQEVVIDFDQPNTKQHILAVSPSGKVPVWVHDDLKIWDSLAICEYLAELAPQLWPEDQATRAIARSVVAEMHSGFVAMRNEMGMNVRAKQRTIALSDAAQQDLARIEQIWTELRGQYQANGEWLFGKFSIADAMFAPVVIRLRAYAVNISPIMQSYVNTFYHDPDFQQWIKDAEQDTLVVPRLECGQA
ncbi:glutathione S-transferase family protein [Acinetobacter sp. MD2(2019)]|uniref:glutathione S-transferase family protein n=1 Tax=Acinetobacter sp. MD2(2019) TaxID=2605273 RepID=UPI002D1EC7D1|nr:glutathione S-transferase family protein [Acinetobacter sp. MD2(2019)]MEB3753078.1 glutathione S-transferase family protein [Acinetobacter sp. MD2(2019)]